MEKILKKITTCRRERGFTFENMGHELDITMAAYRKIEIGKTRLTVDRLFKISNILNLHIRDLISLHSEFTEYVNEEYSVNNIDFFKKLLEAKDEQIFLLKEREKIKYKK
ncbi:helix-turn-helix transcriptional regulator [Chryseobacterium wangxinyae]|uniref:helix-turn-helix domain-containing protein n=1 Tax=Chryseobacterium sp. CY350 TaxID=2997336 RepID=UPI00226DAAA1|nr:helix-turn-helix transcriptional regulator [Chryseobacterium sp. CY350]MCY0977447.1 helix-turn-helix transcriptional regulator [Chryseobacterium sp. CY350]WBZ95538.1 helix-turn-helix transcriptional regulator [Chryseobacterium sp. CY350]